MAHSNNGSSDFDAWIGVFGQVAKALGPRGDARATSTASSCRWRSKGDPDAGGLLSINYVSGEHVTGFTEGRPLFARNPDSKFTLENFIRAMLYASLCAMRTGMDILTERGGGGHRGDPRPRRLLQGRRHRPAHDGRRARTSRSASRPRPARAAPGAWRVLAAYMLRADAKQSLPDYLDERIAESIGKPVKPDPRDVKGFAEFFARHKAGLAIEREAVKALR